MMMVEGVKEWAHISQQLKQLFHMKLKLNSNVLLVNPYTLPFWKPRRFVTCSSAAPSRNRHPKSSSSSSDREAVRSIRLSKLYCEKDKLSEDQFEQLKALVDIGDVLGASGTLKRTEKGELSMLVSSFAILTKSLLPLPDKYHGLTDVDTRYRQQQVETLQL